MIFSSWMLILGPHLLEKCVTRALKQLVISHQFIFFIFCWWRNHCFPRCSESFQGGVYFPHKIWKILYFKTFDVFDFLNFPRKFSQVFLKYNLIMHILDIFNGLLFKFIFWWEVGGVELRIFFCCKFFL